MTKKQNSAAVIKDEDTKWFQRGFSSKQHYQGWLQFNDLIDEGFGFDDVYHDEYTGNTVRISRGPDLVEEDESEDEAAQFLAKHQK